MIVFLLFGSLPAMAAPDGVEFYRGMLDRGIRHFGEGNYRDAVKELRSAAFGLVEVVDDFETAHVYLAIALQLTGRDKEARQAIEAVVAAERIEDRYAALAIPADIRDRFEAMAQKLMAGEQLAILHHRTAVPTRPSASAQPSGIPSKPATAPSPAPAPPSTGTISPPAAISSAPPSSATSALPTVTMAALAESERRATEAREQERIAVKQRDEAKSQLEQLRSEQARQSDAAKAREQALIEQVRAQQTKESLESKAREHALIQERDDALAKLAQATADLKQQRGTVSERQTAVAKERDELQAQVERLRVDQAKQAEAAKARELALMKERDAALSRAQASPAPVHVAALPAPIPALVPVTASAEDPVSRDSEAARHTALAREQERIATERKVETALVEIERSQSQRGEAHSEARTEPRGTQRSPEAIAPRLDAADRALAQGDFAAARTEYSALLDEPNLDRSAILRCGEGLYRALDFRKALAAFDRAGSLRPGEEMFGYYAAVACYETGQYAAAKKRLAAVLPRLEITPEVDRYRVKIQGAIE